MTVNNYDLIVEAMVAKHPLRFVYTSESSGKKARWIDPYKVDTEFLHGAEHGTSDFCKKFKLSKITKLGVDFEETYTPAWPVEI